MITSVVLRRNQPRLFALAQRHASAAVAATATATNTTTRIQHELRDPDPEMVDARQAPSNFVPSLAVVYRDFATEEEAKCLANDVGACLKRRRYEMGHWDSVIINYKETELMDEDSVLSSEVSKNLLDRIRYQLQHRHLPNREEGKDFTWLPCHAIDLHKEGQLNAHVDSVRFSGDIVAGLSLLSPSIMRLVPDDDGDVHHGLVEKKDHPEISWVDMYLPPRSLYVLSDAGRYHYSHQLLPSGSVFYSNNNDQDGEPIEVQRDHRLSVIFRDSKD